MSSPSSPRRVCFAVLGDEKVGKTALIRTFLEGKFPEGTVAPFSKFVQEKASFVVDDVPYVVELTDGSVSMLVDSHVARRMDCLLLCYSTTSLKSLNNTTPMFLSDVKDFLEFGVPVIIVGLQKDAKASSKSPTGLSEASTDNYVTIASAKELAFEWKANASMEVSAKTGDQMDILFQTAVRLAIGERKPRSYAKKCTVM